jgi:hypothetical protein
MFWLGPQHGASGPYFLVPPARPALPPAARPSKWSVLGGLPPEKWSWHGGLPVRRGGRGAQGQDPTGDILDYMVCHICHGLSIL